MYILAFFSMFLLAFGIEVLLVAPAAKFIISSKCMVGAFIHASVYAIKMGFAYMVMLSIMSFNLGIFIAAMAGHALGYFLVKARALTVANRREVNVPKI